jgi:hypothetical protein
VGTFRGVPRPQRGSANQIRAFRSASTLTAV